MGSRRRYILAAGVLFALTFHKYLRRDPVGQSVGLQGTIEVGLTLLTCLIVLLSTRGIPRRIGLPIPLYFFGIYGAFAFVSSVNSFDVKLSVAKGVLYFSVLLTAYLISEEQVSLVFLAGVYRGYIATLIGALTLGMTAPHSFPLFSVDSYSGRTRLCLLATYPNSLAEASGLLFLLAQVLPIRTRWYWQAFLLGINIYAGEKTATAALALCAGLIFLFGHSRVSRRLGAALAAAVLCCAGLLCVEVGVISGLPGTSVTHAAESIYGTRVSADLRSLDGRTEVWAKGAELAESCIILGFGFDGARDSLIGAVPWAGQAHNGFLQAMLTAGLVGMLALIAGWVSAAKGALSWGRTWNVRVLSLHLYLLSLALVGPVFDERSYFTILLFVVVLYVGSEGKADLNTYLARRDPVISASFRCAD